MNISRLIWDKNESVNENNMTIVQHFLRFDGPDHVDDYASFSFKVDRNGMLSSAVTMYFKLGKFDKNCVVNIKEHVYTMDQAIRCCTSEVERTYKQLIAKEFDRYLSYYIASERVTA